MKTGIIHVDVNNLKKRSSRIKKVAKSVGYSFTSVIPHDLPKTSKTVVQIPETPTDWKCTLFGNNTKLSGWYKCETSYMQCWQQEKLDLDYVWCIEGDVYCDDSLWKSIFTECEKYTHDLICLYPRTPESEPGWMYWSSHPKWGSRDVNFFSANICMFRISKKYMELLIQTAKENRNAQAEVVIGTTVADNKGSIIDLNDIIPGIYNHNTAWHYPVDVSNVNSHNIYHSVKELLQSEQ